MNYLKYFESFLFESNRAPLYHFTRLSSFEGILQADELFLRRPYFKLPKKDWSISLTRNKNYIESFSMIYRFELDTNKLKSNGFNPIPIHEFNAKSLHDADDFNIPLNQEEERIYKAIPKLGKYIINIDILDPNSTINTRNIQRYILSNSKPKGISTVIDYLIKYPHINLRQFENRGISTHPLYILDKTAPIINAKSIEKILSSPMT